MKRLNKKQFPIKKFAINIISLILGLHMLNTSVNVDDRLLDIGNNTTNEIETIYELLKVSFLGEDHAIADTQEINEEKSIIISYFNNSNTPIIPTESFNFSQQEDYILQKENINGLTKEISSPPPRV